MIMRSAKILTSLILIALCPPITLPAAKTCKAASTPRVHSRISPELVQRIKSDSGAERVRIVIQLDDSPLSELNALLIGLGANVTRRLNQLKMRVVELPVNAVEALASRPEVRYISTDRQIASQGHLENTTGTAAARAQTTTSLLGLVTTNVFDGRGVTIAIVDSGIDENHVSFRDAFGFSRVIARQDFTGENRTDDPYGHGTCGVARGWQQSNLEWRLHRNCSELQPGQLTDS